MPTPLFTVESRGEPCSPAFSGDRQKIAPATEIVAGSTQADTMTRLLSALFAVILMTGTAAFAFEPMSANIMVSSGALYDYVVVGENPRATDGFDNAYDTISPGNLNADMGSPFISVIVPHPDWKPAFRELRGDIRSTAKRQEWQLSITSSLPEGTPLSLSLQAEETSLPARVKLTVRKQGKEGKVLADLSKAEEFTLPAPGPGKKGTLFVVAEQP